MDSRRGISFQWRMFVPVVLIFWLIIICMAWWQVHRVTILKKEIVHEQLKLVAQRVAALYENDETPNTQSFLNFINDYYIDNMAYDAMSIVVLKPNGTIEDNIGNIDKIDPGSIEINTPGVLGFRTDELSNVDYPDEKVKYLYYAAKTRDDQTVCVLLPFTRDVARTISNTTTKFWLVFLAFGIGATILAYFSSHFISRNIKILRDFAHNAANDPTFVSTNTAEFPHDELGDISRQIMSIYNQRVVEMQCREREHKVALHAIEEKNRIKRELTGNINHELKTPVGVIQGYIDTLVENPDMDVETRDKFLYKAQENVHRLSALITDITAITRLESGDKLVNVTDVDFHDLVFSFDNMLQEGNVLQDKLTFSYEVPMPCMVLANESLLHSVLLNLAKNAAAYSKGTMCRLELDHEDDKFYYFNFYDDGVGVAPEHLPHMFERFYRVNSGRSRDCGGTGLGLSIVEVTIKSFGGDITVSNRYPNGLQFSFSLPKYKQKAF